MDSLYLIKQQSEKERKTKGREFEEGKTGKATREILHDFHLSQEF